MNRSLLLILGVVIALSGAVTGWCGLFIAGCFADLGTTASSVGDDATVEALVVAALALLQVVIGVALVATAPIRGRVPAVC